MSLSDIDSEEAAKTLWEQYLGPTLGSTDKWDQTSDHLRGMSRDLVAAVISIFSEQLA